MDTIINSLINIVFYPVTAQTFFLVLPVMMCFVMALWQLIGLVIRGKY